MKSLLHWLALFSSWSVVANAGGGIYDGSEDDDIKSGASSMSTTELLTMFTNVTDPKTDMMTWAFNRQINYLDDGAALHFNSTSTSSRDQVVIGFSFQYRNVTSFSSPALYGRLFTKGGNMLASYNYRIMNILEAASSSLSKYNFSIITNSTIPVPAVTVTNVGDASVYQWSTSISFKNSSTTLNLTGYMTTQATVFNGISLNPFEHSIMFTINTLSSTSNFTTVVVGGNLVMKDFDAKDNSTGSVGSIILNKYATIVWWKNVSGVPVTFAKSVLPGTNIGFKATLSKAKLPFTIPITFRCNAYQALYEAYLRYLTIAPKATGKRNSTQAKYDERFSSNCSVERRDSDDGNSTTIKIRDSNNTNTNGTAKAPTYSPFYAVSTKPFPRVRVSFVKSNGSDVELFTFRVGTFLIAEVNDTIGIGNTTSFYNFTSKTPWTKQTATAVVTEGVNVIQLNTNFTDNATGLFGQLTYFVSNGNTSFTELASLSPQSIKWTITIANYNYQYENSRLVIVKGLWSSERRLKANSSASNSVNVGSFGGLSWVQMADADDLVANVKITNISSIATRFNIPTGDNEDRKGESYDLMAYEFVAVQPNTLTWDPSASVAAASVVVNDAGDPSTTNTTSSAASTSTDAPPNPSGADASNSTSVVATSTAVNGSDVSTTMTSTSTSMSVVSTSASANKTTSAINSTTSSASNSTSSSAGSTKTGSGTSAASTLTVQVVSSLALSLVGSAYFLLL